MAELLPTVQAGEIRTGLLDYLTTTFALADPDAQLALADFLSDRANGIFKGPYLRLRLPFRPAEDGWQQILGWDIGMTPYSHQAQAFARLSSADPGPDKPRPLPTLVTTGTGSGKTEAFLYPILDHVLRARRDGVRGTKALILYPMNALANDQAARLSQLLTSRPELAGIAAAIYTGQDGPRRTMVTADGLITDRAIIRSEAPDILLTNYKMLDLLLLRSTDHPIWRQSAVSLQYVVLDEFHTYDGAQGTDVAILLRRLGLVLKSYLPDGSLTDAERARPLGRVTPVATSATLGDKGDPAAMTEFARTVFGDEFDSSSVVTESRLTLAEWSAGAASHVAALGLSPRRLTRADLAGVNDMVAGLGPDADPRTRALAVFGGLYDTDRDSLAMAIGDDPQALLPLICAHPLAQELIEAAEHATHLTALAERLFPGPAPGPLPAGEDQRVTFLVHLVATLSHIRARAGRQAPGVDLHLWVRELSRIDRVASSAVRYLWSDDGALTDAGPTDSGAAPHAFPALYCRHCGRSGWGVGLAPVGSNLDTEDTGIRRNHASREGRFRALIYAPAEADHAATAGLRPGSDSSVEGLRWFSVRQRVLLAEAPAEDDPDYLDGLILPVLTQTGPDADDDARDDTCPSCQRKDGIRFLGSAIATLLSVTLSTLFGDENLDAREKKALVFTDSVQDAAHRAAFVESRSHVLTLRSVLRHTVGERAMTLDALVDQAIADAGDDRFRRYRLIPPGFADREEFAPFWQRKTAQEVPNRVRGRVRRRLLFDAVMEFGLQSAVGRTLEQTGSVVAEVDAGESPALAGIARAAITATEGQETLEGELGATPDERLAAWVRGVLERMRVQGSIDHEWFGKFIEEDGSRYRIWGGRPRGQGMPAFPKGRPAPAFPRIGPGIHIRDPLLDSVTSAQSWYARWTARCLGVTSGHGARLARQLLDRLARADVLRAHTTGSKGTVYAIRASTVIVAPTSLEDMRAGRTLLTCPVCHVRQPGTPAVIGQLDGAPCLLARCPGTLRREPRADNYYRNLYASRDMRRIVAREHTSLLEDKERLTYEAEFRSGQDKPGAPNVLVATPTLEMGIDIGDLSAVMLASLPRSVASYLQRVGRAGRLTGNALNLAFVTGRGENLPRLADPLSVINGMVRPPATYLSAEEILRRQYVAHLADLLAADEDRPHPHRADHAMASADDGTYLGDLIAVAERDAGAHLTRFLGSFTGLADASRESLRTWATPITAEPRTSGLAAQLYQASLRWRETVEELERRKLALQTALPEIERIAELPAASDDDKRALRSARAGLRLIGHQLDRLRGRYWIQVLEEFGVLPNYTLLDDSVVLDVSLTWVDPETQEYRSEAASYHRSSASALSEFAPGATFYVQGLEITVDAVDLGTDDSAIHVIAVCAGCGYARVPDAAAPQDGLKACPRCASPSIAGREQHLDVVELARVSAEMRRDEAAISDRTDERRREWFSVTAAADIDPEFIARRWYINDYDFGTKYLRRVVIRWLNLGRHGAHGATRTFAGEEVTAPLFRLCEGCGVLDRTSGTNRPEEHRAWCRYRKALQEHTRTVALARTLTTQGAVIRLPRSVTIGDQFAVPSLAAALLLGLHEQIGGSPDHIDIIQIAEPVPGESGTTSEALLFHDVVPGGTGYLAELADPARVWDLLYRAWDRVRDCECQAESRLACHRCLLPFARRWPVDRVSRSAAERHLRAILTSGQQGADPAPEMAWSLTEEEPALPDTESHLEQRFRVVFRDRVTALGATVKETPGPRGNRLSITFPGHGATWTMEPQVMMGGSKPDFVLTSSQGGVPPVAVFTDGRRYHASPAHNRIADDTAKRRDLRDTGKIVLAITSDDVDLASTGGATAPVWLREDVVADLMQHSPGFSHRHVDAIRQGPIHFLLTWLQHPDLPGFRALANQLPLMFASSDRQIDLAADADLAAAAGRLLTGEPAGAAGEGAGAQAWWWSAGGLACVARLTGSAVEMALVLDDRDDTLAESQHADAWREWLRISNALILREQPTSITALSAIALGIPPQQPSAPAGSSEGMPADWAALRAMALPGREQRLVDALFLKSVTLPEAGLEAGDGIPIDFAWPGAHIAVCLELTEDDRHVLESEGWHVLPDDPEAIADALDGDA